MHIILDERENALYEKCLQLMAGSTFTGLRFSKRVLALGDILLQSDNGEDLVLVERKSFADLLSSIKDGRYDEQSYRLLYSSGFRPHSIIYLVEGMFSQLRTPLEKKLIYSAITSLNFFKGFSIHRAATLAESAEWILFMAEKMDRDAAKGKVPYWATGPFLRTLTTENNKVNAENLENVLEIADSVQPMGSAAPNYCTVVKKVKKENVTPSNILEIVLCQIPGISSGTAIAISNKFRDFPHFMDEIRSNAACLENITMTTNGKSRKINGSSVENIKKYLLESGSPIPTA